MPRETQTSDIIRVLTKCFYLVLLLGYGERNDSRIGWINEWKKGSERSTVMCEGEGGRNEERKDIRTDK